MFADPTVPLQHYRVTKFFKKLNTLRKEHEVDGIIDAGDTTDDRSSLPIPTIDAVIEGISKFKGMENFKVVGNHEQFMKNSKVHVGRLFESVFNVYAEPAAHEVDERMAFVFAPFPPPGQESEFAQKVKDLIAKARGTGREVILIGHFSVLGSEVCGGKLAKGLDASIFEGVTIGLLGDIHRPQKISVKPPVWYVGSPFQQDFGEAGERKRVALLDTEKRSVVWLETEGFPEYRQGSWKEFSTNAREDSEDRWKVVLTSTEETEAFYAHPLSHRAEPEYAYEEASASPGKSTERSVWSLQASLKRYAERVSPASKGIEIDVNELVSFGENLATHS